jgi:hypothetical protein
MRVLVCSASVDRSALTSPSVTAMTASKVLPGTRGCVYAIVFASTVPFSFDRCVVL